MQKTRWMSPRLALAGGLALLLGLLLGGCGFDGVQSTLEASGPVAERQAEIFMVTVWVSVGIFAVVGTFLAYCIWKFRYKGEVTPDTPLPDQGHGDALTEIGLILVSVFLVGVIALPTLKGIFWMWTVPEGEDVMEINVVGYQWWWRFEYPEYGVVTANELAMPVGRPVKFNLKTMDVIHAFWVPKLGGKMDLMPGQDNWLWLEAGGGTAGDLNRATWQVENGGVFYGQCAEFCGESHAFMRFRVVSLNDSDFRAWLEHQRSEAVPPATPEQTAGRDAFMKNQCAVCHTIRGVPGAAGLVGPDLTHFGSRLTVAAGIKDNTVENVKQWLTDPHAMKPGNTMYKAGYEAMNINLDQAAIDSLAEYLMSLK